MAQLLDRIDDRFALLEGGDRLAAARQRSLAATVEWSYRLLDERRAAGVPRGVGVPGAVHAGGGRGGRRGGRRAGGAAAGGLLAAGPAAGRPGWPVPVRDAGDAAGLRGGAAGRGRGAGRRRGRAGRVRAAGGRGGRGGADRPATGEVAAARWLDAEDATMRQALDWAMEHDAGASALRLAAALALVVADPRPAGGSGAAAARGRRPRRRGQRRVVRRAHLARPGVAGFGRSGRGAAPLHRGPRRHRGPAAVPRAGQVPERPVGDVAGHGPDRRGGRRCPPFPGPGPGGR